MLGLLVIKFLELGLEMKLPKGTSFVSCREIFAFPPVPVLALGFVPFPVGNGEVNPWAGGFRISQ